MPVVLGYRGVTSLSIMDDGDGMEKDGMALGAFFSLRVGAAQWSPKAVPALPHMDRGPKAEKASK